MKKKLYAAYGSNLNIMQMGIRCPHAKVVGVGKILNYKLTFCGVATIDPEDKCVVPVAVWEINSHDEKALDKYESYPVLYRKEYLDVQLSDKVLNNVMVYVMNSGVPAIPSQGYFECILAGYEDVGIDPYYLTYRAEQFGYHSQIILSGRRINDDM